jgi:hypothetical protein
MGLLRCLNRRSCPTSSAFFNYPAAQPQLLGAAPGCDDRLPERPPPPSTERRPVSPSSYGQLLGLSIAPARASGPRVFGAQLAPSPAPRPPYRTLLRASSPAKIPLRSTEFPSEAVDPLTIRDAAAGSQRPVPHLRAVPSHARLGARSHRGPQNHQPSVGQGSEIPRNLRGTEQPGCDEILLNSLAGL